MKMSNAGCATADRLGEKQKLAHFQNSEEKMRQKVTVRTKTHTHKATL